MRRALEARDVPGLLLRVFPDYRGRKFSLVVCDSVTISDGNWSGGKRSSWLAVNLATGYCAPPAKLVTNPPQFGGDRTTLEVPIPAGWCVVEHSIFCGKDEALTFYLREENAAPLLPAMGISEVSRAGRVVLYCTYALKSFARRDEAERYGVRTAAYNLALKELKGLGYVNAAGAVTIAGRNACRGLGLSGSSLRLSADTGSV